MSTESAIDGRLSELHAALAARSAENEEIIASVKTEDGVLSLEKKHFDGFKKNLDEARQIQAEIKMLEEQKGIFDWSRQPAGPSVGQMAAAVTEGFKSIAPASPSFKTVGQAFIESEEFKALQQGRAGYTMPIPFEVAGGDLGSKWIPAGGTKDVFTAMPTGTPGDFGTIQRDPMVPRAQRTTRVRDLFPVQRTDASVIEYFRVTGFTNNASVVPQRVSSAFGAKPQSGMTVAGEQAAVRTIAHWEAAHRNVLADEPQLRGIIDTELLYGLRLAEDNQILNGTGTGEDLKGILTTSGVQSYSWSSGVVGDQKVDAIRRAATLAFLAYYEPTGIVCHPNDWEDMELTKDDNGQYLVAVSVALGGEPRLWRLPLVDTPAIAEGTALVGSFGLGAQLYDREQSNIRVAEQHEDFFVRNAVVVLAEERLALATKRPESFVKVTFNSAPV